MRIRLTDIMTCYSLFPHRSVLFTRRHTIQIKYMNCCLNNISQDLAQCRICSKTDLHTLKRYHNLPTYLWPLSNESQDSVTDLTLYYCNSCGHYQLQDFSDSFISSIYEKYDFINFESVPKKHRLDILIKSFSEDCFQNSKVIDIGGGINSILGLLPNNCEKWVSDFYIDADTDKVASYSLRGNFLGQTFPEKYFDSIFSFHSLEHMNRPGLAIEKMRSILAPTGRVFIEVPSAEYYARENPFYFGCHQHPNIFSLDSLDFLMGQNGFVREKLLLESEVLFASYIVKENGRPGIGHHKNLGIGESLLEKFDKTAKMFVATNYFSQYESIGVYGAGGTSKLFLAHFPALIERVKYCYDINPKKHHRTLINGRISVRSPEKINTDGIDLLLFVDRKLINVVETSQAIKKIHILDESANY